MAKDFSFKILCQDKNSKARVGVIKTAYGEIKTPCFVPVGTQATVKSLTPGEIKGTGTQVFFVNTYHLFLRPGVLIIEKLGGLHQFISWSGPLMTDSGGFQIFSLARGKVQKSKIKKPASRVPFGKQNDNLKLKTERTGEVIKIDNEGVTFRSHWDGKLHRFTPEKSIEIQKKLGADIIFAFDECAPYPAKKTRVRKAIERTHRWALRSLKAAQGHQALFGIVQGGVYKDLREESAKFISNLPFEGVAIGGVSVGESKKEMYQVCDWVVPLLPKEKPRHLLGVGEIDDIFEIIKRGIDMFDCVMPTRIGRMGHVLVKIKNQKSKIKINKFQIDITKSVFASDPRPIEKNCQCFTCQNFSRAYINHLFRVRELLAYRLATIHNLYFVNNLVAQIREAAVKGKFLELKRKWLS